jgi:hypothetical protein
MRGRFIAFSIQRTSRRFNPYKGVEYALDGIDGSFDSLVSGIIHWLHVQWRHSCPDDHCNHHVGGAHYSGKKILQRFNTLSQNEKYMEKSVTNIFRKILPKL